MSDQNDANEILAGEFLKKLEYENTSGVPDDILIGLITRFYDWAEYAKTDDIFYITDEVDSALTDKGEITQNLDSKEQFCTFVWNDILQNSFEVDTQIVDFHILKDRVFQVKTTREQNTTFPIYSVECMGKVFDFCSYLIKVIKELIKYRKEKDSSITTQWILTQLEEEDHGGS